ncbi:hypothetical protein PCCS19_24120 [Paenibacillus sp. CCS19]|nr:hypothetical protein PCCS19_24120 [Paenibacillus cellulosilyticus]
MGFKHTYLSIRLSVECWRRAKWGMSLLLVRPRGLGRFRWGSATPKRANSRAESLCPTVVMNLSSK